MSRVLITEAVSRVGEQLSIAGWVHSRRDHGGLIFIDVRDHTGVLQLVINPEVPEAFKLAGHRDEYVVMFSLLFPAVLAFAIYDSSLKF